MAEDDVKKKYPSLPSNYVSLAQLQERWLKEKQQKEEEQKLKQQQEKAAEKQELENYCKNIKSRENVKFEKDQNFDRSEYIQRGLLEKKKGKAKVEKYVEKGVNFSGGLSGKSSENEGYDGNFWGKVSGGGGGRGSVCTVEMETPVVVRGKEGFRGGLKRNGRDGRAKFRVFENGGEGKELEGRGEGLQGEKEEGDAGLVVVNEGESTNGRGRGGYKRNWSKKGRLGAKVRRDFEDLSLEEGRRGNGRAKTRVNEAEEGIVRVESGDLSLEEGRKGYGRVKTGVNVAREGISGVESGGNDGKDRYTGVVLENVGEGEDVDEKGGRLEGEKEENAGTATMNRDEGIRGRARGRYPRNLVKKGMRGAKVRRDVDRQRARENEDAEETPVVVSGKDGCTDGLQRNGNDQMVNGEVLEKVMEGKGSEESEGKLGGKKEAEDEGLVMASQRNGERFRFRGVYRGNWDKKKVSGAKFGGVFEDSSLKDGKKGKGRGRFLMNGGYQRYQKSARFGDGRMGKQSDSGVMWVKKGEVSDANSAEMRPSGLLRPQGTNNPTD